jgi:hypothetical protein
MFETVNAMTEAEMNAGANAEEFVTLADLQLTLIGGGSGIAQLD